MKFKLILRNLWDTKFYSLLNILGLAIGMSVAIITLLYLQSEWTYDQHNTKYERIFRVGSNFQKPELEDKYALTGRGMGNLLQAEFPEIEKFVRFNFRSIKWLFQYEDKSFFLDDIHIADSTVLDIFDHQFIAGNPETALDGVNKIVLSRSVATLIFGKEDPLGKVLKWNTQALEVSGVFEDLPKNTHFIYKGLISNSGIPNNRDITDVQSLNSVGNYTYILLKEGTTIQAINDGKEAWVDKYGRATEESRHIIQPIFEPLAAIHFQSDLPYDRPHGNTNYIYAFLSVGLLILLLASINYVNLATARAVTRAKEIGVKKVVGATRSQLIGFFQLESLFITGLACLIALGLTEVLFNLSNLNTLLGKDLSLNLLGNPTLVLGIVGIFLLVSALAGLYPAFYLSNIEPMGVLRGAFKNTASGILLRRTLVVFQFAISIGVVGITLLMSRQIDFLRTKDLGFDKENVLHIPIRSRAVGEKLGAVRERFLQNEQVVGITLSNQIPGIYVDRTDVNVEGKEGIEPVPVSYMLVDHDYLDVMNIELLEGRNFELGRSTDSTNSMIVNEKFVLDRGWDEPIGKKFVIHEDSLGNQEFGQIIGVVKDFNTHSLHEPMLPVALWLQDRGASNLFIKIKGGNTAGTISWLSEQWRDMMSDVPMDFSFLDDSLNELYNADERQSKLLFWLSIVCGLISCLGLFGLASFTTAQRTKEMGVRKIMGASVSQIVGLLFKEVMAVVAVAAVVAVPMIYWSYNTWSAGFAYHLGMDFAIVLLVTVLAVIVAFVTISFHASRLALSNPVNSLRME